MAAAAALDRMRKPTLGLLQLLVAALCLVTLAGASQELLRGISYGPSPLKKPAKLPNDDFMAPDAKALWGSSGRGDLAIMQAVGANAVRLYGNDPGLSHTEFLDEAQQQGLKVIPGMSDYPYTQMQGSCISTGFNCFKQLKEQYALNLKNGFLASEDAYHPALHTIIVINEPDLKIPGITQPNKFCKAIISAIDGMLDAEKDAGVTKNLVNFTATMSFGICSACKGSSGKPSLGQMLNLRAAMLNPESVNYTAKNDLAAFYKTRFTNSFNTNNPARDIGPLFLNKYEEVFTDVPVFIGEYHAPRFDTKKDMAQIMEIAEQSQVLTGVAFFEFQVRYDKGGSEMDFGMFGLGPTSVASFTYFGEQFEAWCLTSVEDMVSKSYSVASAITAAFGGKGIDEQSLCVADPRKVQLTEEGFEAIQTTKSTEKMAVFVTRVVEHMGGLVNDQATLENFASKYSGTSGSGDFGTMAGYLGSHPSWVSWDSAAACVADRGAFDSQIGDALAYACGAIKTLNCSSDLPDFCANDLFKKADYVFSAFFHEIQSGQPLRDCYFNGAAAFAPSGRYLKEDDACILTNDPATTAVTEKGYQDILNLHAVDKTATFIERVAGLEHMKVVDEAALNKYAASPPATLKELQAALKSLPWLCGGATGRDCPAPPPAPSSGGSTGLWVALGVAAVVLVGATVAGVVFRQRCAQRAPQMREPFNPAASA